MFKKQKQPAVVAKASHVVLIGGGTGSFALLGALKDHFDQVSVLVNMADSGGSTGVLRDELGVLPPGDVRQCLVALSEAPEEVRELFNFRFPSGSLAGHAFGNIFLSAVEKMTDNFNEAVRLAGDILQIRGQVIPITLENCQLVLEQGDQTIVGEYAVAQTTIPAGESPKLALRPDAAINPDAAAAIASADLLVIAPGNLYASLAPALLVDGVAAAIQLSKAKKAYVCNLVNKPEHTANYAVHDYATAIERYIGAGQLGYVLYNVDHPSADVLKNYALEQEYPVAVEQTALAAAHYTAIPGNFLSRRAVLPNKNDHLLKRSLIRHDGEAIAQTLRSLLG